MIDRAVVQKKNERAVLKKVDEKWRATAAHSAR